MIFLFFFKFISNVTIFYIDTDNYEHLKAIFIIIHSPRLDIIKNLTFKFRCLPGGRGCNQRVGLNLRRIHEYTNTIFHDYHTVLSVDVGDFDGRRPWPVPTRCVIASGRHWVVRKLLVRNTSLILCVTYAQYYAYFRSLNGVFKTFDVT